MSRDEVLTPRHCAIPFKRLQLHCAGASDVVGPTQLRHLELISRCVVCGSFFSLTILVAKDRIAYSLAGAATPWD